MTHFFLNAMVKCRKLSDGFKVTVHMTSDKFNGGRAYSSRVKFVGDIDHFIARVVVEVCSDLNELQLHTAIRALEVTHNGYKNIYWALLKGSGYAARIESRSYYNSSVYNYIAITNLIGSK